MLLATLIVLILAATIIFFVMRYHNKFLLQEKAISDTKLLHQQELIEAAIQAEEHEKERISKNVHDELGTYSSLLKMNHSRLTMVVEHDEHLNTLLDEQKELIHSMTTFVRNITNELASPTVRDFGIVAGIRELSMVIEKNANILFTIDCDTPDFRLDKTIEIQSVRVVKEIVNNLLKHAKPKQIVCNIKLDTNRLLLSISHDGKGIVNQNLESLYASNSGMGLKSVAARVQSLNGNINYKKSTTQYFIDIEIPLNYEF